MNNHRFTLEPYKGMKTRHVCPGCGKKGVFALYNDNATGQPVALNVGRCNREINCGYHYKPGQYFEDNKHLLEGQTPIRWNPPLPEPPKPPTFIDLEIFKKSRKQYEQNNFIKWLSGLFDATIVNNLIARYHLGTSKHWPGATVFWQVNQSGQICTGKIMGYNPTTGHRIKEPFNQITWIHKALKLESFNLQQCYFGEHLLKLEPGKPVALVESEKTAIVASAYLPGFIWLAVGSLQNINVAKCKPLAGRKVVLFPDLNGFEKWSQKAAELQKAIPGTRFDVSDLLERKATEAERQSGLDLADYLTRFDWRSFNQEPEPKPKPKKVLSQIERLQAATESLMESCQPEPQTRVEPQQLRRREPVTLWDISGIETYFANIELPTEPIKVNKWTIILDVSKFIDVQLTQCKAQNGNPYFKPGFDSLHELKNFLSQGGGRVIS
jgi:hypothetical protein